MRGIESSERNWMTMEHNIRIIETLVVHDERLRMRLWDIY